MNCDQVFNVLTRGPFPTGNPEDADVEHHLAHCAECWRFAEALRPAVDVFEEAVLPAESRELPGYWGDAQPAAQVVAELARRTTRTAIAPRQLRRVQTGYYPNPYQRQFVTFRDVLTVVGFVATLTVCALGLGWFAQLW